MPEALWLTAAGTLCLAGMGCLALAMEVHWAQLMRRPPEAAAGTRKGLRWLGAMALSLAGLACGMADRPAMAALVWVMLLSLSGVTVALALALGGGKRSQRGPRGRHR